MVSSLLIIALAPALARAECVVAANATPASTCVVYTLNGVQGVWFEIKTADELRKLKLEVPELRLQISTGESLLTVERERSAFYQEAAQLRAEALAEQSKQVDKALSAGAAAQRETGAWYRSPVLWFSAGVLLASAVSITAAKMGD